MARWLGNVAETALMHVWVRKMKRGRVQDRILAITRFRIVTFKYSTFAKAVRARGAARRGTGRRAHALLARQMCRNGHFFELRSATWKDDGVRPTSAHAVVRQRSGSWPGRRMWPRWTLGCGAWCFNPRRCAASWRRWCGHTGCAIVAPVCALAAVHAHARCLRPERHLCAAR